MRLCVAHLISFTLLGFLVCTPAHARIVNVLGDLPPRDSPSHWALNGSADISHKTGNTQTVDLGGELGFRWTTGPHTLLVLGGARYATAQGNTFVRQAFEHVRYRYLLNNRLGVEAYAQHAYDGFRRLRLRGLVGAGPFVVLYESESWEIVYGSAYLLEYESSDDPTFRGDGMNVNHRWSQYLRAQIALGDSVRLVHNTFYQPRIDSFSDVHIMHESSLAFDVNEHVTFSTSFWLGYESVVANNVEKLDTSLTSALTLRFGA